MHRKDLLLIDNENETLVDLPSGKISKDGKRVPIKAQQVNSCFLYATRRIAFFDNQDVKYTDLYQAFSRLREELNDFKNGFEGLLNILKKICKQFNLNTDQIIFSAKNFSEADKHLKKVQCCILYEVLLKQRIFSLFHIQESKWHPKDGFTGLKESIRNHGAHVFVGKFGFMFYTGVDKFIPFHQENEFNREVYAFKKENYTGDSLNNSFRTHAVLVDQVKIVDGREMVFFRDPYDDSDVSKNENIYALSYENFVKRLTNLQGFRYARNECENEKDFGIVSTNPYNLLKL